MITTDADGARSVHAADLDGDGDLDVLSASRRDDKVAWYENLGGGNFSAQRVISTDADSAYSVHAADLDGDGDADVLSASGFDNKVAWYENLGGGNFSAQRVISTDAEFAVSVHAADLDGDGDADVLSASDHDDRVAWYENLGGGDFSAQRVITTDADGASSVHAADLDGDDDADVLSASTFDDKVAWYENLGGGNFSAQHVISTDANSADAVDAADLDGDGDTDVLSASRLDDKVAWYENLGSGVFSAQHVITTDAASAAAVHAVDLDGDGDADVLAASYRDNTIAWHENLSDHGDDHRDAPDNQAMLATAFPAFLHGTLESGGDRDVFRFATGNGTLRAYSNGPTDTFGRLLNADGAQLASDDDSGSGGNFEIEADVEAGVHYVEVRGFSSGTTGPYTLSIEFVASVGDDHGDSRAAATLVASLPFSGAGLLESEGDRDVFRIVLDGTGTLSVHTSGETDTYGRLLDANGNVLAEDDDRDEDLNFLIEVVVGAGVYYVEVSGYADEVTGPYTLSIEFAGADGSGLTRLTNNSAFDVFPAWSPDGLQIAFASDRTGNFQIYVMNADGTGAVTRLTNNSDNDVLPAWSPDGTRIAFMSDRAGNSEIYVMNADGTGVRRLTNNSASDQSPAWSRNGAVAFESDRTGGYEIYVMNADGTGVRRLTNNSAPDQSPVWSPDGGRIAFRSDHEIYVMNADGSGDVNLTNNPTFDDDPAWSSDGLRIAFSSSRDGNNEIYVMNADGSDVTRLTNDSLNDGSPTWSPDGTKIAFDSNRDGNYEIYVMNAGGDTPRFDTAFTTPTRSETVVVDGIQVEAAENEILVFLDEDVSSDELSETRAEIIAQGGSVKSLNFDLRTIQVGITDAIVEQNFIDALAGQPGVSGANVNEVVEPDRSFITSNEQGYQQWRTKSVDFQPLLVPPPSAVSFAGDFWIDQIDATSAWTALSDPNVSLVSNKIGIVDTGVPSPYDVLDSSRISRYTEGGVALSGDDSSHPHGYNVTGYAAGYGNGPDRRGVNPHSDVVFVDVWHDDSASGVYNTVLLQAIKAAIDKGAGVVNISWGPGGLRRLSSSERQRRMQRSRLGKTGVVHYARQGDVLLVWSAGNEWEKNDDRLLPLKNGQVDVATDSWLSHTLIVGASTGSQTDACFSLMGAAVNIMAPGDDVGFGGRDNRGRRIGDGTSYAAPMVTGAAGLIRAIESTISAEETRSILINSARDTITFNTTCGEPVASSPAGLLNLGSAIQSSLVANGVGLNTSSGVQLARNQTQAVPINVTVPAGGANAVDVGFVIDQSGSYEDDIQTLQNRATEIVNTLLSRANVDVHFGVAGFADFPQAPYGRPNDVPYRLYQSITDDTDALIAAIDNLNKPLMSGNDFPESQYEALFRAAREIGWRDGALRILLLATDEDFHDSDTESGYPGMGRAATLAALAAENVIVIGLQSGGSAAATRRLQELADATGGSVLSLDAASSQIVDAIERGLDAALAEVDVTLDVLAGQSWVSSITPAIHQDVRQGATVSFTVLLEGQRDPSIEDLPYNVYLWARGDGSALLSRTKIPIIVPRQ